MLIREDGSRLGSIGPDAIEADVWTAAEAVIRETIAESQSLRLGYFWIYQKVLDDQEALKSLIRKHKLIPPGLQ